jgi:hypothetical protein
MPFVPHSRVLGSVSPDLFVLVLLALCVVVAAASAVAYARCRREEREFECIVRRLLRPR